MRPKIVLAILLPAIAIIGAIIFVKPHPPTPVPVVKSAPAVKPAPAPVTAWTPPPAPPPPAQFKETPTPEERQAAIDSEIDRLDDWAMNDDPQSLSNILNDLNSPEKEIRLAAVEAAKQFESTNAIPALRAAAAHAEDSQEAIAMLEAADWLALPTADFQPPASRPQLTPKQQQAVEQDRASAKARRQEYLQKYHSPNASQSDSQSVTPAADGQIPPTTPNN